MPFISLWKRWRHWRKQIRLDAAFWNVLKGGSLGSPPNLDTLSVLLKDGANINSPDPAYKSKNLWAVTPLSYATRCPFCTADTVRFLLENGASVALLDGSEQRGRTPNFPWAAHGRSVYAEEKFRLLFDAGAKANAYDPLSGRSVIWEMTTWASDSLIESALERGANPNCCAFAGFGWTPLHLAAWGGRDAVVSLYLRHGADPLVHDKEGRTPRMLAETREPITNGAERPYVPNLDECVGLLLAAEQKSGA